MYYPCSFATGGRPHCWCQPLHQTWQRSRQRGSQPWHHSVPVWQSKKVHLACSHPSLMRFKPRYQQQYHRREKGSTLLTTILSKRLKICVELASMTALSILHNFLQGRLHMYYPMCIRLSVYRKREHSHSAVNLKQSLEFYLNNLGLKLNSFTLGGSRSEIYFLCITLTSSISMFCHKSQLMRCRVLSVQEKS